MSYLEQRRKHIEDGRPLPPKKKYYLKGKSDKRIAKELAEKEIRGDAETEKQKWFGARRKEMKGFCACGCGERSSKNDDVNYRSSICHIFPQRIFPSVQFHPMNWVERRFWIGGCHSNMDNKSMDLWPNFEDWDDIVEKFHALAPILTDEERATKFYTHLERLIYEKR